MIVCTKIFYKILFDGDYELMQETTNFPISKSKIELGKKAVALALDGQWENAAECNRAILDYYPSDVETMNRLAKSLIELNQFIEARSLLSQVIGISPYNTIAKKNLLRLDKLEISPNLIQRKGHSHRDAHIFMGQSGKSGTTLLQALASGFILETIAPGQPLSLVISKNTIEVRLIDGEYIGRVEPKLAMRLIRLINLGNRYKSAVVSATEQGIVIIIQETYRDPSSQRISGFPFQKTDDKKSYLGDNLIRYMEEDDSFDQDIRDSIDEHSDWE